MIAFLDVYYGDAGARSACVLAANWQSQTAESTHFVDIESVEPYESGQFYRRELPCLLSVLASLPTLPDVIVIDGYVWLPDGRGKGLGAHLYEALESKVPVVGVAKTEFVGAQSSPMVVPIRRGDSSKPLFVTALGVAVEAAASLVQQMAGPHRIPNLIKIADQLSRSEGAGRVGNANA